MVFYYVRDTIAPQSLSDFTSWKYIKLLVKLDILFNDLFEVNYSVVNLLDIKQYHAGEHTHMCLNSIMNRQYCSIVMIFHGQPR